MKKSSGSITIKKEHLKEDSADFKRIKKDSKDISKEVKKLSSRDTKAKR